MMKALKIYLTSPDLFERVYKSLNGGSSAADLSEVFSYDDRICFNLLEMSSSSDAIDLLESGIPNADSAYLDQSYENLHSFFQRHFKTIWFNPGGALAEDDFPRHDLEIQDVSELININSRLYKPSLAQCLAWLDEWDVPDNVRAHSAVVAHSAYVLAVMMRNRGISVDPVLTHRGGLLHDIDKIATLKMGDAHGRMGAEFLDAQGYPRLAEILREHIMTRVMRPEAQDWGWEVRLVFFCDKLVEGDGLVTFDQRLNALKIRYPYYVEKMERAESAIWDLSNEICEILDIPSHAELVELLRDKSME
jgi:putative hydrolase of the HAD superfamily